MKRNIYINKTTDARLAAFGGAGRAENLRRAVALAEVAGELAEELDDMVRFIDSQDKDACVDMSPKREILRKYKEAKNVN